MKVGRQRFFGWGATLGYGAIAPRSTLNYKLIKINIDYDYDVFVMFITKSFKLQGFIELLERPLRLLLVKVNVLDEADEGELLQAGLVVAVVSEKSLAGLQTFIPDIRT